MNQTEINQIDNSPSEISNKENTNTNVSVVDKPNVESNSSNESETGSDIGSNDQEAPEQERGKKLSWNMILREILFILALALTTYDAFQNSPPKISGVPIAKPFFGKGSLVTDWYKGQLSAALQRISSSEISFVMYYAPWDAESQHVRQEFEKTAHILFNQVHFSAVNCWQPGSECRLQHNKISMWPIIMVYTAHLKSVVYTGPKDAMNMVKFLHNVMKPLHRVSNANDLKDLKANCDVVVLGFEPVSYEKKSTNYNRFYTAALKSLEYDPNGDVCFAVVTSSQLGQEMGVKRYPTAHLIMWNITVGFPQYLAFKEEHLVPWVWEQVYKKCGWHVPQWHKSFALQKLFASGPVLILFTPRNLYFDRNPNYDLFREVALEYSNCGSSKLANITNHMALKQRNYVKNEIKLLKICAELEKEEAENAKRIRTMTKLKFDSATKFKYLNRTLQKSHSEQTTTLWFSDTINTVSRTLDVMGMPKCSTDPLDNYCPSLPNIPPHMREPIYAPIDDSLKIKFNFRTSMITEDEPRSALNLLKRKMKQKCKLHSLGEEYHKQVYPNLRDIKDVQRIDGLSCETNRTLSFLAMDSIASHHFAESLGIDILNIANRTALFILDDERESQYRLNVAYGDKSLRDFIYNFTMDLLERDLKTVVANASYTHYYGSDIIRNMSQSGIDMKTSYKLPNPLCPNNTNEHLCVHHLNTDNFQNFIMQPNKAVLVAMCSVGAGPCGGLLSMVLLAVNRILGNTGLFSVGRIDSSKHDLPWQHTVSKYPTLIFYPMTRKSEYFSYPENEAITIEGVLAFVLSGMEAPLKLYAQVLICNQTKYQYSMNVCLRNVRNETVSLIGHTLKQLRRFNKTSMKNLLLKRLEYLRAVYISLGALHTTKLPSDNRVLKSFVNSVNSLIQIWNFNATSSNLKSYGLYKKSNKGL